MSWPEISNISASPPKLKRRSLRMMDVGWCAMCCGRQYIPGAGRGGSCGIGAWLVRGGACCGFVGLRVFVDVDIVER